MVRDVLSRLPLLFAAFVLLSPRTDAQTADEIIARNLAARGGLQKIQSVKSMTVTGRLSGPGMNSPIKVRLKRPNMFRMDLTIGDKTVTQAFDGTAGWQLTPGNPEPQVLTGSNLASVIDQADIDGPAVDYKAKGNKAELIGKQTVNGNDCYKLKLTLRTGTTIYEYIDTKSFLEVREELVRPDRDKPTVIEESVGEYRDVGGILYAHLFDSNRQGSSNHIKFMIETIETNRDVDPTIFKMPAAKR